MRLLQLSAPLLATLLALGALFPSALAAEARPLERIVAVVNDNVILASDLEEEVAMVRQQMLQRGESPPSDDVLRERILDQLITEELQLQRARRFGLSVDDEAVNRALQQIAANNNTDISGLREQFAAQGVDFSTLREDVRNQLIMQQLQQGAVHSRVNVAEQEIDDLVAEMAEEADTADREYRIEHILISTPSGADDEAVAEKRREARAVIAQLEAGADFAELAAEHSDGPQAQEGGDLGWRGQDQLPTLFVEALEGLQPGDLSEPLESSNGFHILRLADRRGGAQTVTETRARQIFIRSGDREQAADDAARERIHELRRRLDAGEAFNDLAATHSDDPASADEGGEMGWFGPGDVSPAFQEVIDDLGVGEISEPFQTEEGWHIAEVQQRREAEGDDRHLRAEAEQRLFRNLVEEETERWISELRDEAFIEKRLERLGAGD